MLIQSGTVKCHSFVLNVHTQMLDLRGELTELIRGCSEAVLFMSRGASPPPDDHAHSEVEQLQGMADAVSSLEDTLGQRQHLKAVQLLRWMRKQWKGEEFLGMADEDDVDCLFFIYAKYVADRRGKLRTGTLAPPHRSS